MSEEVTPSDIKNSAEKAIGAIVLYELPYTRFLAAEESWCFRKSSTCILPFGPLEPIFNPEKYYI